MSTTSQRCRAVRITTSVCFCVLCVLFVNGCAWSRQRINVENFHAKVGTVVKGETTQADLERAIGTPPNSILMLPNGKRLFIWTFGEGKTKAFSLILVTISKTNLGLDSAIFLLDEAGIVEEFSIGTNSKDVPWQWWAFGDA